METFPRIAFAPEEFRDTKVPTSHVFAITESDGSAFDHHEPSNITRSTAVDQFNLTGTRLPETAEDPLLLRRHRTCATCTAEWAHEGCVIRERVTGRVSVDPRKVIALTSFEEVFHNLMRLIHAPRLPTAKGMCERGTAVLALGRKTQSGKTSPGRVEISMSTFPLSYTATWRSPLALSSGRNVCQVFGGMITMSPGSATISVSSTV